MSLATKILNKQKRIYFNYLWRGLALMAIGSYAGIMIMKNGMGTAVNNGRGANVWISRLMAWLTQRGANAEQLVTYALVGLFFIIAAIGLFNVVRGAWLMLPTHTMLGKSVLLQARSHERFSDVMDSINGDMEQEPHLFGAVAIGRKWILDMEAMRIEAIRGVFWFDQGMEDYVLCCVDESQNIWASGLRYRDDRDKDAYIAFLGGGSITDDTDEQPAATV